MSTGKLYQEAINEANDLIKMAEERARDKLIESVMPRIRTLLEKRILEGDDDDSGSSGTDDDDMDLILGGGEEDEDAPADLESSSEEDDMQGFDDISAVPAPAPVQAVGSLDIKVPKGVNTVTLTVAESKKKGERIVTLDESNVNDLIKLVDGKGTLAERGRSIQLELKMLRRELDALNGRGKQLRTGGRLVEEFNAILRKSIGLKQEIKDCVPGPLAESAKLEFTKIEKEIIEMSTKTLLRSLLSEGRRGKMNEMYDEGTVYGHANEGDDDMVAADDQDSSDLDDMPSDDDMDADAGDVDVDAAKSALEQAAAALGMKLVDADSDLDVELSDEDEEGGDEEGEEEEEQDEDSVDEGVVFEIDESMLRRELGRLRSLREAANAATQQAHHFGGGKAHKDAFEDPVKLNTLDEKKAAKKNALPEEEETVKESRRNRALTAKLDEAAKAVHALNRQLAEQKLFNAKLLYVNKLMQSSSLTDKQFRSIVEALDSAKNLREAHLLYTSLNESLAKPGRALSEGARSAGGSSRPTGTTSSSATLNEGAVVDRWAMLAGIKK